MRTILIFTLCLMLIASASVATAQQVQAKRAPLTARPAMLTDQTRFDTVVAQAAKFLSTQKAYSVTVHSAWTTSRGAEGQNAYWLTVQQPNKFRVEVQSGAGNEPEMICVSDGNLYSRLPAATSGMQRNKLLAMSLAGSGLDVLLAPNVVEAVNRQATDVKYLGIAEIGGGKAHGFQMAWAGQTVQLYFAAEGDPLLKQFVRKTEVATGADSKFEMQAIANLSWKLNPPVGTETFTLSVPKDATKCHDIYNTLAGEESSVVGESLPALEVTALDGSRAKIGPVPERPATVLIFWATWCAPSVQEMPSVTEFVQGLHAKGIGIYAVNVAEPISDVRRFSTKHGLEKAVVIDETGELACQLQIDDLPAAVVIDADGKVRSVVKGKVDELKTGLTKELAALAPASFNVGSATNKTPGNVPNRK
jgi:thiol-disulfide isomerase/thioredoxin